MGTNFYLRKKLNCEETLEILDLLEKHEYQQIRSSLVGKEVHIGKRSGGWKFLWNANNFVYFSPSKHSLMEWLKSGEIIDEYGGIFTFDQFIRDEVILTGLDIEAYHEKYPNEKINSWDLMKDESREVYQVVHGVYPNKYGEFYIEDLRFTTCTDFS